jgi:O-antigen ligase
MSQVVLEVIRLDRSDALRPAFLPVAVAASIFVLWVISAGNYEPVVIVGAAAGVTLAVCAAPYTWRHTEWLIFVIGLLYLTILTSLLSEDKRAILHYGVLAAFCLPLVMRAYGSGLLWEGNFKLYCAYFAWALATTYYSLAPKFSAGRWAGAALGFCAVTACVMEVRRRDDCYRLLTRFLLACAIMTLVTLIAGMVLPHSITWQTPADGFDAATLMRMREQGIALTGLDRFRGIFGNANDVGSLMLITVSTALACWNCAKKYQKALILLLVVVAVGLAVVADSRSPFVALIAGAVLYTLWRYRLRATLGIGLVLAAAIAALGVFTDIGSYVTRGDVGTLTGRTDMWAYVIEKIREQPLLGYGYEVNGAIFDSRYFTLWYGPWDEGPHSSLHNGYLSHCIGVGIPATLLWLFVVLRPWIFAFRQERDPWNLKIIFLLMVVPLLVYNLTEAALGDFLGDDGFLFGLAWAIAERFRILETANAAQERAAEMEALPGALRALRGI